MEYSTLVDCVNIAMQTSTTTTTNRVNPSMIGAMVDVIVVITAVVSVWFLIVLWKTLSNWD